MVEQVTNCINEYATLTIWFRFCCDGVVLLVGPAGFVCPAAGATPFTTVVVVGVCNGLCGCCEAALFDPPTGLARGTFEAMIMSKNMPLIF